MYGHVCSLQKFICTNLVALYTGMLCLLDSATHCVHVLTVFCLCFACCSKIAIKRELGLLRSTLLTDYSYPPPNSISRATPTSACSILAGMRFVPPVISQQHPGSSGSGSKGHLSGKLRPLSLPKPTIILPFSHSKTMTILKDGHMKPVSLQ